MTASAVTALIRLIIAFSAGYMVQHGVIAKDSMAEISGASTALCVSVWAIIAHSNLNRKRNEPPTKGFS